MRISRRCTRKPTRTHIGQRANRVQTVCSVRVTVLGSGSRGNAILVEGAETCVLVDAGFGPRTLAKRLAAIGKHPTQISALLLTHEHTDHASGAVHACRKWGWPLYASHGTLSALGESTDGCPSGATALALDCPLSASGFDLRATAVPHDARECTAFVLSDQRTGVRIGIALDLGHVPSQLPEAFSRLDFLVVESNHDERLLANGPYPWSLKQRIGGALGHLSNGAAAAFVSACTHRGLRGIMLAHLSETNNTPAHALARTRDALRRAGWRRDALWAAHQTHACGPQGTSHVVGSDTTRQLYLAL